MYLFCQIIMQLNTIFVLFAYQIYDEVKLIKIAITACIELPKNINIVALSGPFS